MSDIVFKKSGCVMASVLDVAHVVCPPTRSSTTRPGKQAGVTQTYRMMDNTLYLDVPVFTSFLHVKLLTRVRPFYRLYLFTTQLPLHVLTLTPHCKRCSDPYHVRCKQYLSTIIYYIYINIIIYIFVLIANTYSKLRNYFFILI